MDEGSAEIDDRPRGIDRDAREEGEVLAAVSVCGEMRCRRVCQEN